MDIQESMNEAVTADDLDNLQMSVITSLQLELTGALIGLARTCSSHVKTDNTDRVIMEGLSVSETLDHETLQTMIDRVHAEKHAVAPDCSTCPAACGNTEDFDMQELWKEPDEIRALKVLLLSAIRGMAVYGSVNLRQGYTDNELQAFLMRGLSVISYDMEEERLRETVMEAGRLYAGLAL